MSFYLITGVSRGLGFEFLRQLSGNAENTIFGLVRDKASTDKKVAAELGDRANIHILQADTTDYEALKTAVIYVSSKTGGALDYIIANAALVGSWSGYDDIAGLAKEPARLEEDLLDHFKTNVVGPVHLFNLFTPLILHGKAKKVTAISTGLADLDLTAKWDYGMGPSYSISKAALNSAVAKFSAVYRKQGILFMTISPGMVNTGNYIPETEEIKKRLDEMFAIAKKHAPHWEGPITPKASVEAVLSVIEKASVDGGDGGSFVSHYGNKQWV
ncbi:short-chain dehydrogenase [Seiridium cupressi]